MEDNTYDDLPLSVVRANEKADEIIRGKKSEAAPQKEEARDETVEQPDTFDEVDEDVQGDEELAEAKPESEAEEWKKRFANLRNKRDEDHEEALRRVKAQNDRIAALEQQLSSVTSESRPYKVPASVADELGEDIAKALEDSVNGHFSPQLESLQNRVSTVGNALVESSKAESQYAQKSAAKQRADSFLGKMSDILNVDASALDKDPAFVKYAQSTADPATGRSLADLYIAAYNYGDVSRCAEIARSYLATKSAVADPRQNVSPQRAATGPTKPPAEKPITREFVRKFYDDMRRGRYDGNEKKAAAIERKINEANRAGKIL